MKKLILVTNLIWISMIMASCSGKPIQREVADDGVLSEPPEVSRKLKGKVISIITYNRFSKFFAPDELKNSSCRIRIQQAGKTYVDLKIKNVEIFTDDTIVFNEDPEPGLAHVALHCETKAEEFHIALSAADPDNIGKFVQGGAPVQDLFGGSSYGVGLYITKSSLDISREIMFVN